MNLPTKLFHYSKNEVGELRPDFYEKFKERWPEEGSMKPCGLWVSVEENEDDYNWFDWCKSEQFRLEELRHKYSVILSPDINILHIKTPEQLHSFSLQYASNDPFDFASKSIFNKLKTYVYMISWLKVKKEYDGIIISPYQGDCRLSFESSWYCPWDCSSGCIWNVDKVSMKLHSLIDVESIREKQSQEEESVKDSQPVCLDQST